MNKVVLLVRNLTVSKVIVKARFVVSRMTENAATFPNPDPPLATLTANINDLEAKEGYTQDYGGKDRTAARDLALEQVFTDLDRQVYYVQGISNGSAEIAAQAGMDVRKEPRPWPVPEQVIDLRAQPGEFEQSVYLIWKAVPKRKGYRVEMLVETPTDNGNPEQRWETVYTGGKRSVTLRNLVSNQLYTFRVLAFNAKGDGPVSEPVRGRAK